MSTPHHTKGGATQLNGHIVDHATPAAPTAGTITRVPLMPRLAGTGTPPVRALWLLYDPDTFEEKGFVCSLHLLRTPDEPHAETRLRTAAVFAARADWRCQFC